MSHQSNMPPFVIYGATGYTGRIACQHAKSLDLPFVISGKSPHKLASLAAQLDVPYRVLSIDDFRVNTDSTLEGVKVLLNCAGPFAETAEPLMEACIQKGVHYLDVSAELSTYQLAEGLDKKAAGSGTMLLPGCGGSVAMLGCLALHALRKVEEQKREVSSIDVALRVAGPMSRGSAITARDRLSPECLQRRQNELIPQDADITQQFDFANGEGGISCIPVTLPDLVTIWKATEVPNVRTFVFISNMGPAPVTADLADLPDGPTAEQREANPYHAAAVVTMRDGSAKRAVLHTVNGYTFTGMASVEAARKVLNGEARGGFQTPAGVFGEDFVTSVPGSQVLDI